MLKRNIAELSNLNEKYSSKMKRIFIELHNYSFNHGSLEVGNSDERFIGRERLLEKFKSILTNTKRKSGIYLVTGYRGMGKTSFVNKALEEVYSPSSFIKIIIRWGLLLLVAYMITLFLMFIYGAIKPEPEIAKCLNNIALLYGFLWIISLLSFILAKKKIPYYYGKGFVKKRLTIRVRNTDNISKNSFGFHSSVLF